MKKNILISILLLTLISGFVWAATFSKGQIGIQDLHWWDGDTSSRTFTRDTSTDYSITLKDIDIVGVNVAGFGGYVNFNSATISSALTSVGSSNTTNFFFSPTVWTIDSDVTITSNITTYMPAGASFAISAGKTLTIQGPLIAGNYTIKTGSGTMSFTNNYYIPHVLPEWWGAVGDNSTDDEAEINEALATGHNVKLSSLYGYRVDDELHLGAGTAGQTLFGNSRMTTISVDSAFDGTEDGVIQLGASNQTLRNIRINFNRVDESSYPAAIDINAKTLATVQNVTIEKAYDGIDATGDVYGLKIDGLKISSFNMGIEFNGLSTGGVELTDLYFSPNVGTLDASQITQMGVDACYGIQMSGATVGFSISNSFFNIGTGLYLSSGNSRGNLSNVTFYNENGINMTDGTINVSSSYFSINGTDEQNINQSGTGTLAISDSYFVISAAITGYAIDVTAGRVTIGNSTIDSGSHDKTIVYATGNSTVLTLTGNIFNKTAGGTYTTPVVYVVGNADLIAGSNWITGGSTGDFIKVDVDDDHVIRNNHADGWDIDLPADPELIQISGNVVLAASAVDQKTLVGPWIVKYYEDDADASGDVSIDTNISALEDKVLLVQCFENSAAGDARLDYDSITIDDDLIEYLGTCNACEIRCVLVYSTFIDAW